MNNVIQLAPVKPHGNFAPRPIRVYYPGGTMGHSTSLRRAIVNATRHLLSHKGAARANIFIDDVEIADLEKAISEVTIRWRVKWARGSDLW